MCPGLLSTPPLVCCLSLMFSQVQLLNAFPVSFLLSFSVLVDRSFFFFFFFFLQVVCLEVSSEKSSVCLLSCSWAVIRSSPFLSLTSFTSCWLSSCQLHGDAVQVFHVSLCCNFYCLSCEIVSLTSLLCSRGSHYLSVSLIYSFEAAAFAAVVRLSLRAVFFFFFFFLFFSSSLDLL